MILIDTAEPADIIELIKQSVPVAVTGLNLNLMADYRWCGVTGRMQQVNRTQAGELLSDIDSFEDELRRYYKQADDCYWVYEGIISPVRLNLKKKGGFDVSILGLAPPNSLFSYSVEPNGFVCKERIHKVSYSMFCAWVYQMDKCGITMLPPTVNSQHTAKMIVSMFNSSQKPEHSTLNRYYKPKIQLRNQNPHIAALMFLSSAYKLNIGEEKATAIIEHFGDLFNVLMAEEQELDRVAGIGEITIKRLFKGIGREE